MRTPQSPENGRQRTGREGRGGGDGETGQRVEARARVRSPERGLCRMGGPSLGLNLPDCEIKEVGTEDLKRTEKLEKTKKNTLAYR